MGTSRTIRWLLLGGLIAALPAQAPELPGVRDAVDGVAKGLGLDGAALVVVRADRELHRSEHGAVAGDTVMPIASASKWLAVATVLTVVDEGKLDMDVEVGRYVEEFDRDDLRAVTVRQCLSCTSGLPARLGESMRGWDMQRFAEEAAGAGLRAHPNTAFVYGGVGFQVAAVAACRATGKDWHTLFEERIAGPLGMRDTRFGSLQPIGGEPGRTALPWVAGGAVSSLDDYARFVRMLLAQGEWDGVRVLSQKSVADMFRDQVREQIDVRGVALVSDDVRYGLGTWIERLEDGGTRVSDPGALGFTPWIDLELGVGGVFAVQDRAARVLRRLERVHAATRAAVRAAEIPGGAETVELEHGGRDRRYHLHVPPHQRTADALPLLVVLHGGGGSGEHVREVTRLDELGVEAGFVVAFPDGTGRLPRRLLTWNAGGIDVWASRNDIDDVGFLRAVVADVQQRLPIDPRRVFVAGHSNGGMMCHRLAREAADVFTGIAVVAGAMNWTGADATSPLAVLLVHGTKDRHVRISGGETEVRFGGGEGRVDAPLQAAVDYYVERNGLKGYPESITEGGVRVDTYATAKQDGTVVAPVRVVTLEGGGHAWPGTAERPALLADAAIDWPASRAIVEFFTSLQPARSAREPAPSVPR